MDSRRSVRDAITDTIGFCPKDAVGWLYVARAYYKLKDFHSVVECAPQTLRNEKTKKEGQHLLAFALLQTQQLDLSAAAFKKSIALGNDTDWQALTELLLEHDEIKS